MAVDQETRRKLRLMNMCEMVDMLDMMAADPAYAMLGFDERLKVIVDYAYQEKQNASIKRLLGRAHLRIPNATIAGLIFDGRPLERERVANLAACQFIDTSTDIIIEGFTGTGKTYLACALARQACMHGIGALYVRMPDMFLALAEAEATGQTEAKLLKRFSRYRVLVIDEWLLDPLSKDQRRFMLELIDRRHDQASTIFCSQYGVGDWHRRIGGGVHADAIMDRIVHNAITLKTGDVNMRKATAPLS